MQNLIKILIVEDEVLIADYVKEMLQTNNFVNVKVAYDKKTAIHEIKNFEPELLILDINIDTKYAGIEIAKLINNTIKIIFLTAQNDENTILKALETNPQNYLTKPIREVDLLIAIKLASSTNKQKYIVKKEGYKEFKIYFDEILYIKSDGNYIDLHTINKKIVLRQSLDTILAELDPEKFVKVHRSYIVNKEKVTAKTNHSVFINVIEIPLSRSFNHVL